MKCAIKGCQAPATKKVIWADGRAYQPACDHHVGAVKSMLTAKNGKMAELSGVQDLSDVDLVDSHVYPGLERKPGIQNWVDKAGGLPDYIERIAKHLHYEKGMTISRAIATAVNTVKRWARMGKVAKYGSKRHVSAKTVALATKALAEWYAKRAAGKINLSEELLRLIDLTEVSDEYALHLAEELGDVLDLAEADISSSDTMVALMLPPKVAKKIAIDGGTKPEDMHVTLTFHGATTPQQYKRICEDLASWAADGGPGPLQGHVGGLGQFPDTGNGVPHFAPADVPGINQLHEQVKAVTEKTAPASTDHGYTPHTTLTYTKPGETPPSPVPSTPVQFSSMHVVRGNKDRTEIPLGDTRKVTQGGAAGKRHARLRAGVNLSEGPMDLLELAERANRISDPATRAVARARVLDLAVNPTAEQRRKYGMADGSYPVWNAASLRSAIMLARTPAQRRHIIRRARALGLSSRVPDGWSVSLSEMALRGILDLASTIAPKNAHGRVSDGRRSYKSQGRWKHGFIPVDGAAKESKAKGSPIAVKRLNRIFGSAAGNSKSASGTYTKSAKSRAGQRSGGTEKINAKQVTVTEGKQGARGSTGGLAFVNSPAAQETNRTVKKAGSQFKEASKQTRIPKRARQNWDEIPANLKTERDGKRYVVAEYQGGQYITPWVGGVQEVTGTSLDKRKVYRTLSSQTANSLTPAQLRDIIANSKTPASVKKAARLALRTKAKDASRG